MPIVPHNWGDVLLPQAPLLELVVRGSIIYVVLLTALRTISRRQLTKFGISDLLVLFLLASAVRNGLTGKYYGVGDAVISMAVLLFWDYVLNQASYYSPAVRRLVRGRPVTVVKDGEIVDRNARMERLTPADIKEKLREHGIVDIARVELANVEPDGKFSVVKRDG